MLLTFSACLRKQSPDLSICPDFVDWYGLGDRISVATGLSV
ncbi:hypothetical protein [Phocaeicola coprocola]|nr:hypothetical protein [Phocaeicola coprocola]